MRWLVACEAGPAPSPDDARIAVQAWNLMGGFVWDALPTVFAMLGVKDPELVTRQLVSIREYQNRPKEQ